MGLLSNRGSFNKGVYHFSRGEYLVSIDHYRKAVKKAPGDAQAWNNLGLSYYKLGKIKDAMKCFDDALRISPEDPFALTNKAALILAGGRHGEARFVIDKVLIKYPDDVHALNLKGLALMKDELFLEAHDLFMRAVDLDPRHRHAVRNLEKVRIRLASLEMLSEDDDESEDSSNLLGSDETDVSSNPRRGIGSDSDLEDDVEDLPRPREALPLKDRSDEDGDLEDSDPEDDEFELSEYDEFDDDTVDWEE